MSEKIYADGMFIKSVPTTFGHILKVNIKVSDFTNFLEQHVNQNDFVTVDILERKTVSDKGHTHYAVLNEFKPKTESEVSVNENLQNEQKKEDDLDGLPF